MDVSGSYSRMTERIAGGGDISAALPASKDAKETPMPLHPVTESDTADSGPTLTDPHALTASPRALDQVLILLQGVAKNSLADPGITLLPPAQLDLLTVHAR